MVVFVGFDVDYVECFRVCFSGVCFIVFVVGVLCGFGWGMVEKKKVVLRIEPFVIALVSTSNLFLF